jgi:hypothetical protein
VLSVLLEQKPSLYCLFVCLCFWGWGRECVALSVFFARSSSARRFVIPDLN